MNFRTLLLAAVVATASLPAQQTLRGKVEDVRNTQNQFFLDGTTITVRSQTLNLNTIVGQESILQVLDVGAPGAPVLEVLSATPTAKVFDMGNLRLGRDARWQVNAPPGSFASVHVVPTSLTGWMPFGPAGVWLLGTGFLSLNSGFTNGAGQFEFTFVAPNLPELVGTSFTGQALVGTATAGLVTWSFSNPDAKVFESR
jgi:hypothetical protein